MLRLKRNSKVDILFKNLSCFVCFCKHKSLKCYFKGNDTVVEKNSLRLNSKGKKFYV